MLLGLGLLGAAVPCSFGGFPGIGKGGDDGSRFRDRIILRIDTIRSLVCNFFARILDQGCILAVACFGNIRFRGREVLAVIAGLRWRAIFTALRRSLFLDWFLIFFVTHVNKPLKNGNLERKFLLRYVENASVNPSSAQSPDGPGNRPMISRARAWGDLPSVTTCSSIRA
jgi:hypothetical protein